jgi:predicted ATP-dependent protease
VVESILRVGVRLKGEWDKGGTMPRVSNDERHPTQDQADKARTQAREVVNLLEQARRKMAEDDSTQPAMEHVQAALREAQVRAATLEDWYQRTYFLTRGREGM